MAGLGAAALNTGCGDDYGDGEYPDLVCGPETVGFEGRILWGVGDAQLEVIVDVGGTDEGSMLVTDFEVLGFTEVLDVESSANLRVTGLVPADGVIETTATFACFMDDEVQISIAYAWDVSQGEVFASPAEILVEPSPFDGRLEYGGFLD